MGVSIELTGYCKDCKYARLALDSWDGFDGPCYDVICENASLCDEWHRLVRDKEEQLHKQEEAVGDILKQEVLNGTGHR